MQDQGHDADEQETLEPDETRDREGTAEEEAGAATRGAGAVRVIVVLILIPFARVSTLGHALTLPANPDDLAKRPRDGGREEHALEAAAAPGADGCHRDEGNENEPDGERPVS